MKVSRVCLKCDSRKVVKVVGSKNSQTTKFKYTKWGHNEVIDRYVCMTCGYFESHAQLNAKFKKWGEKQLKQNPNDDFIDYV